jgi:hypothetical protein
MLVTIECAISYAPELKIQHLAGAFRIENEIRWKSFCPP